MSGDRRARRSAAVAAPINYAAIDTLDSSDEADASESEQASSSEDGSDAIGGEGGSSLLFLSYATSSSWTAVAALMTHFCIGSYVCQTSIAPSLYAESQSSQWNHLGLPLDAPNCDLIPTSMHL